MMRPIFPILHRYVLGELLRVFLLVLTVFTVLTVFAGVFQEATERGLGPLQVVKVLPFIIPSLLPFTIPATLLLTVSVVYGRIAGDQEITAAKAAGINPLSLMGPAFFLGGVLSVCSLLLADQVIPWAETMSQRTIIAAVEEIFLEQLRTEHQLRYKPENIDITVEGVVGRRLIAPVFRHLHRGQTITVQAAEALVEFDHDRQVAILHMRDARADTAMRDGSSTLFFELQGEEAYEFPLPLEGETSKPRQFSLQRIEKELVQVADRRRELEEHRLVETAMSLTLGDLDRIADPGFAANRQLILGDAMRERLRTEYHSRFALSCSCFFFVLLGCPFAILKAKSQFLTSFLYCFGPIV
ncbi:MAG: LptF/LptG family permease, partial [Planctomycetaceae bacterium]|nr:LptF/LptG family permease [Planctomycetaceae bacterium]